MIQVRHVEPRDAAHWIALRAVLWPEDAHASHAAEVDRFLAEPVELRDPELLDVLPALEPILFSTSTWTSTRRPCVPHPPRRSTL